MNPTIPTIAISSALLSCAGAQTVSLSPLADATLYQSASGDAANGAGEYLFSGTTLRENASRRALLRFDLSMIPPTASIESIRLDVFASRVQAGVFISTLRAVSTRWTEGPTNPTGEEGQGDAPLAGDCTWIHASHPISEWNTPGGDTDAALTTVAIDAVGPDSFPSTAAFVEAARRWLESPQLNFGLMILGDESTNGTAKRFDSRSNPILANRPRLVVDYRCPADFNHDSFINADDYDAFASAFDPGALDADINADGFVNADDFDRFAESFEGGC